MGTAGEPEVGDQKSEVGDDGETEGRPLRLDDGRPSSVTLGRDYGGWKGRNGGTAKAFMKIQCAT